MGIMNAFHGPGENNAFMASPVCWLKYNFSVSSIFPRQNNKDLSSIVRSS